MPLVYLAETKRVFMAVASDSLGTWSEHGHTISSPCEPGGSGELKTKISLPKIAIFEPLREKTCFCGFRPGPRQTKLQSHRRWLEA